MIIFSSTLTIKKRKCTWVDMSKEGFHTWLFCFRHSTLSRHEMLEAQHLHSGEKFEIAKSNLIKQIRFHEQSLTLTLIWSILSHTNNKATQIHLSTSTKETWPSPSSFFLTCKKRHCEEWLQAGFGMLLLCRKFADLSDI